MDTLFWISALSGTTFFVLKTFFSFFGMMSDDVDAGEMESDALDHASDKAFRVFSVHSLTGFMMMFGWVGLACHKQHQLPPTVSIFSAFLAGVSMMVVTGYIFKLAAKLVSPGAAFRIEELVGRKATVYHQIPDMGVGKIQIAVNGMLREIYAVSESHEQIASFKEVKILSIINKNTVSVRPV